MLVSIGGELLVPPVLGAFYPRYHYLRDGPGKLGNPRSPVQWLYRSWELLSGALMILGGVGFFQMLGMTGLFFLILLILYSVGARILPAALSVVEIYDVEWLPAKIYGIARFLGFFSLQLSAIGVAGLFCWLGPLLHFTAMPGALLLIASVVGILSYALSRMSHRKEFQGTVLQYQGLWENLFLVFLYLPFATWAILFLMHTP